MAWKDPSAAHYMRGLADKAYARGFNVVLLNQRNCGGTESLCDGLYHSGLTADAAHVSTSSAAKAFAGLSSPATRSAATSR